jgi:hypothetical protein
MNKPRLRNLGKDGIEDDVDNYVTHDRTLKFRLSVIGWEDKPEHSIGESVEISWLDVG